MKYLLALVVLLSSFQFVKADGDDDKKKTKTDAMLFGDVQSGKEHIPFATITVKGTTIGTAADATGHFKMTDLPVGEQTIVVSAVGYKPFEQKVVFEAKKSVTIFFELERDNIGLEQVVVSADRSSKSRKKSATIVNSINPKLFERVQSVTLSEGLGFSPGLRLENDCQNCGFTQVRMNGLEGPYSQILINSRPVFSGLAGVYGLELIPANMIERVEVVRGGGSSMYGSNAIAGTINLITKDPVANNFEAAVSNSLIGVGHEGKAANDYSINLNGSFVSDDYQTGMTLFGFHRKRDPFDANGDGFSEMAKIKNLTLGGRFYQRLANRAKLTADFFNIYEDRRGGNKFDLPFHVADIAESVTHRINSAAVNFDQLFRINDKFSVFGAFQSVNRDSYYGANQDPSAYGKTTDLTYSIGTQYNRQIDYLIFAEAYLTAGLEANGGNLKDRKLGYYDPVEETYYDNTDVADQTTSTKAGFAQIEWKFSKAVFSTGLRYDHYSIKNDVQDDGKVSGNVFSPRVSFLYDIIEHLQFRTGYAHGFRAPQIYDEDLHIVASGTRKVIHRNSSDLTQETSNSYTASFDYSNQVGDWQFQLLTEGFYTRLKDPFANEYGTPDENGTVVYTRVNAEDGAYVQGVNIELNLSPSDKFQWQSGFTFQKSEYEKPQEFNEKRFSRTPNAYGYFSMNYNPKPVFNIAVTGNYTGPMLVPYFGPSIPGPDAGELRKSPSYFDGGFKLSYDIKVADNAKLQFNAGVKNIFNSYQDDFDTGVDRDPSYIYGPLAPRTIYFGLKIGNFY